MIKRDKITIVVSAAIMALVLWVFMHSGPSPKIERDPVVRYDVLPPAELELGDWRWGQSGAGAYALVEGQVTNVSGRPLKYVLALAEFYTGDGTFITSDNALIDYNPILPGQTSPFKVYATWNPAMQSANLSFKFMGGESIRTGRSPKK